jgi:hypothetical protein
LNMAGDTIPPVMDATSTTNAPIGRFYHTAVWTGSEMIVWGEGLTIAFEHREIHPARIVGQPPTRPLPDTFTRRCGPAVK